MSRTASALALALLLLTAGAAVTGEEAVEPDSRQAAGALRWTADAAGAIAPQPPAERLLAALGGLETAPPAEGARAVLAAFDGLLAPGGVARVPLSATADEAGYPGYGDLDFQGDVTGDGASEVLLVQYPSEEVPTDGGEPMRFRVLSPPDGAELWVREAEGEFAAWAAGVELDGAGAPDVLLLILDAEDKAVVDRPNLVVRGFTWHLLALRGADGMVLWERAESWAYALVLDGAAAGSVASPAFYYVPILGPDVDGDGGLEVWLNVLDTAIASTGEASASAEADRFTLLSGATGQPLGHAALPAVDGFAVALPAGDVTGDGRGDTLVNTMPLARAAGSLLQALDGPTGKPLWNAAFPEVAIALPFPDLTGDAAADVLVVTLEEGDADLHARSGADGAALWTLEDPLFLGFAAGNVDGAAGADLVFLDAEVTPGGLQAQVRAVAGESAAVLYDERPFTLPVPPDGFASIEFRPLAGDFDGDGTADTILNAQTGRVGERYSGDVHALRSADGQAHVVLRGVDYEGRPAGDLTGDGRDDLLRLRVLPDATVPQAAGVDGATGAVLWTRALDTAHGFTFVGGGNLGGAAPQDLAALVIVPTEEGLTMRLDAYDGLSGALLWTAP